MQPRAPAFKWEWSLNTLAILMTFVVGFVGWGYILAELRTGRELNAANIMELKARMAAVEQAFRTIDAHELRITTVERQAGEAATAMRAVEQALSVLTSDVRVTREIVQRIEGAQRSHPGDRR